MSPREELLEQMLSAWTELMTVAQQLDGKFDADLGDGWRVRDVLAHIALWERVANWKLGGPEVPHAEGVADREPWDLNFFNEAMRDRWRDRPVEDVLAELRVSHQALVATVAAASDEDCAADGSVWTVIQEDGAGHYELHLSALRTVAERG
ncbi:MAG: maleylpyruvate isomerase N-terminal domain-containing protein [Nitrolancea sp.]